MGVFMRYWKTAENAWSSPIKISQGDSAASFATACRVPVTHGDVCYVAYTRKSISGGTRYYYADLAKISFQTSGDTVPPGRINDLGAQPGPAFGEATLSWTAPGDDGYVGTAGSYLIKYSMSPITPQNFESVLTFNNPPQPGPAGTSESCVIGNLQQGKTYYFAIVTTDTAGNSSSISNVAQADLPPDVADEESILPSQPRLVGNFPNPFNSSTRIEYDIASRGHVSVAINDILGRTVNTLVDNSFPPGNYSAFWDGKDTDGREVSSRVYFCRMRINNFYEARKMVLLK